MDKKTPMIDNVTGRTIKPEYMYASTQRLSISECGTEGKLYEFENNHVKRLLNSDYQNIIYYLYCVFITMIIWKKFG